jgi:hypothetical protein
MNGIVTTRNKETLPDRQRAMKQSIFSEHLIKTRLTSRVT